MTFTKEITFCHTRLIGETIPLRAGFDKFNPNVVILDFSYDLVTGYFKTKPEIFYAAFVDREFSHEFQGESTKVQLLSQNAVVEVDIFAIPHSGYIPVLTEVTPGNKIRLTFRAKDPAVFDVVAHHIQWDDATGTFLEKEMGIIDSVTGDLRSGASLRSSKLIDPV